MAASIEKVILAGRSGQGILLAGKVLARAGMLRKLEVSWVPETGPDAFGFGVVSTVILAEKPIDSPLVSVPDAVVAFTDAARERLFPGIKAGGLMIEDLVGAPAHTAARRDDVRRVAVPLRREAAAVDAVGAENLVALGALARLSGLVSPEDVAAALREELGEGHPRLDPGRRALEQGACYVRERRYMKDRYALSIFTS